MIGLAFTLDYEVYGDGEGSLSDLVVMPTAKFLKICDEYSVKTTLFVDVAEILAMNKLEVFKEDVLCVEQQLKFAHENGHDIQLHIHPWWFDAKFVKGKWELDYSLLSLCDLDVDEALEKILLCKEYLTKLLTPCETDYSCIAYRAGYWSMMPTENIFEALTMAGIKIDSSVYKWGKLDTELMKYDYSDAYSNIQPWFFRKEDVNKVSETEPNNLKCLEIPIYAERKLGISFLTIKRILLMRKVKSIMIDSSSDSTRNKLIRRLVKQFEILFRYRAKKLDFCKCSFSEMKKMIENIVAKNPVDGYLPVVAIGHSKDFIYWEDFKRFLDFLKTHYSNVIEIVPLTIAAKKYLNS